jgi:uncharacterized protein YkwD
VTPSPSDTGAMPAIYGFINAERAKRGLHVLAMDGDMADHCTQQTGRMAQRGVLYHSDPLPDPAKAEIIVSGAPNWSAALDAWMASDVHREIMLDPDWVNFGAGSMGNYRCVQFN